MHPARPHRRQSHDRICASRAIRPRRHRLYPLTLPNVTRNLVAHELGHALGLGHNTDPAMLMCGRPASCRPDAFQSQVPRFFPLTDGELATLLSLYPPNWMPAATQ
jgi:hypothetical protein